MWRRTAICVGVAVAAVTLVGSAQQSDEMSPKRYTNVRWHKIIHVDYKPQHTEAAIKMVHDHFIKAGRTAGMNNVRIFEYATGGEWDLTLLFEMENGPRDLEWEIHPEDMKWMQALARQEGSINDAKAMLNDYKSMIARYKYEIVRERIGPEQRGRMGSR